VPFYESKVKPKTPIFRFFTGKKNKSNIIKDLSIPADIETNITDLLTAKELENEILDKLLDSEHEDGVVERLRSDQIDALLIYAAYKGNSEIVAKLIEHSTPTSHLFSSSGLNALQLAIFGGHSICVEKILQAPTNRKLWLQSKYLGYSVLQIAIFHKNPTAINAILCHMQSENTNIANFKLEIDKISEFTPHYTALHIAAMQDLPEIARWLLDNDAETEVVLEETKHTPLHLAALYKSSQTAKILIEKGASLRAVTDQGMTALSLIASKVPRALESINPMLDSYISLREDADLTKVLVLDFSKLQTSPSDFRLNLPSCFVTSNQSKFLQHPLCQILLDENWDRVRGWFFARLFVCALLLLSVTVYIVAFHASGCTKPFPK